jgi:hypothetical protein
MRHGDERDVARQLFAQGGLDDGVGLVICPIVNTQNTKENGRGWSPMADVAVVVVSVSE